MARRGIGSLRAGGRRLDYYVNSVSGSDLNDGRTPSTAFASISKLQTTLSNNYTNKSIGLAGGSTFREQIGGLGDWGSNVIIAKYGSGANPILDAADVVTGSPWTKTATFTFVYDMSWTHSVTAGSVLSVWENGTRLRWVASQALCDATAGTYFVDTVTASPSPVYVHASDNGNPNSNGKTYEVTRREWGLMTGEIGSGWRIEGIHTKRSANANGSLEAVNNAAVISCIAEDGWKHNMFIGRGSTADRCIAWKTDYPNRSNATMFVGFAQDGSGSFVTFRNCIAIGDPTLGEEARAAGLAVTGFYAHTNGTVGKDWDQVTYIDCSASGCTEGYSAANATNMTHLRCYSVDCNKGHIGNVTSLTITDCYAKEGPTMLHQGAVEGISGTLNVEGLRHYCADTTNRGSVYANGTVTVNVTKSVLARDPSDVSNRFMVNGNSAGTTVNSTYNIITGSTGDVGYQRIGSGTADFNVYWPATTDFRVGATTYTSFALYKAAELTLDQNSVAADPLVVDAANGNFAVSTGSPATTLGAGLQRLNISYTAIPSNAELAAM